MKGLQYKYIGYEKDGFKTWVEFDNIEYDAKVKRWRYWYLYLNVS